ncbi:Eukaryotic translation initiation factor 3 subunit I [Armadillidium nasatum]|uniref:Eukaryotic translation initiation factor 3 subunit I n=1 Tax=Armadillidium nasatum TaxID=96803 RepID=A0A5N5SS72_9CRUS|nr:Eukaryotic translation initiation factor 3 subunit I [Armadillidium nasatum]
MKPILLQGHERSITQIKFNREGDLLFSSSKDPIPNVWWSINGERLGTFDGHTGAIWAIDVKWDTTVFASGSADQSLRLWDCETGKTISKLQMKASVRGISFSYSGNLIAYTTDKMMGQQSELNIIDVREPNNVDDTAIMKAQVTPTNQKALSVLWGPLDETVVTGHEDGAIIKWDIRTSKKTDVAIEHTKQINDMQLGHDGTMFITASKDSTARLWDLSTLEPLKIFKTDRPVNSAAISPLIDKHPYVVLGGGQEAMEVTTTAARVGKFDARFFHAVFEEEFARVKGHFGPINSLAFHPNGKGYASGGEDGFVRVHVFDDAYNQFRFDY